ncbi:SDR family oxidoreductase [Aliivibrio finisterrensis]|uniref:SDR family oxidoreductase n=1 Tax=Aliivibrio finisterrensis TaxID=511998 RepID=UPI0010201538|nr:SDR family oxidoreductase [Aliivibrio finisterrensis]RYU71213.1 SDR family oxidoreductase [Aliivibrio finisterrensis]RYU74941.1 SDR family oxidoreductase [Aliivibrio finisterrensis]RYU77386.1 SDR family oxidoreductase [Aliivibrio finisterrensis]
MQIEHSTILITSAGNFMGRAVACHFSSLGASLIIADSDHYQLHETHRLCDQLNPNVISYELKDQSTQSIHDLFHSIDETFTNGIDVLINNYTDIALPSLFSHQQHDAPSQLIELTESLFSYGQYAANHMRDHNKEGVIINLGYQKFSPQVQQLGHSASLLAGLTKSWAKELNPFNIRVGGVTPCLSSLLSDFNVNLINQELIKNTEYILENDYFNGRIIEATA